MNAKVTTDVGGREYDVLDSPMQWAVSADNATVDGTNLRARIMIEVTA